MGILNVTPDSFSDGGSFTDSRSAVRHAERMLQEGADVIDVGAVSTRPGADRPSAEEECARLTVLDELVASVGVARLCVDALSSKAIQLAREKGIRMFNLCGGLPKNLDLLQDAVAIVYPDHDSCDRTELLSGRCSFFEGQIERAKGIPSLSLMLDPGVGFGCSISASVELLRSFHVFQRYALPLVIGVSRKSHLVRLLGRDPETTPFAERLEAGLAETGIAIQHGASWVRTHDVKHTVRFCRAMDALIGRSVS